VLLPGNKDELASSSGRLKLKVACSPAFTDSIREDEKGLLNEILTDLLGHPVQIEFVVSSATAAPEATPPRKRNQEMTPMMLQREAERDPQLAPTLNLFEAKILKIEPK
jgi:hypothetical protein